ncbi:DUF6404 family protein [Wenzhouxiangella sp. EGI_FJ10409]|uniref:DUF6404 family protein n=1 Tax=Wenzhouxiangella sp. EGI_FJ10409 TaxID=3243767 RepID=UPI0035D663B9
MSFEKRKEAAMKELKEPGIWKSNSMPPALIILWKLGVKAKPPHYNCFLRNALSTGLWFAAAWGVLMWLVQWRSMGLSVFGATVSALAAGVFFGVAMAAYYKSSARKHQLSNWVDLPSKEGDA